MSTTPAKPEEVKPEIKTSSVSSLVRQASSSNTTTTAAKEPPKQLVLPKGVALSVAAKRQLPMAFKLPSAQGGLVKQKSMAEIQFDKFDADGSGAISDVEFQLLCLHYGYALTGDEAKMALRSLDTDGSGVLEVGEFKVWWAVSDRWKIIQLDDKEMEIRQKASEAFAPYDTESKGLVSKADYEKFYESLVANKLTTKAKDAVFAELDANGDGSISFAEYVLWLQKLGTVQTKVKVMDEKNFKEVKQVLQKRDEGAENLRKALAQVTLEKKEKDAKK